MIARYLAIAALLLALGGCTRADTRLTREVVQAGYVAVCWPAGTQVKDVRTYEDRLGAGTVWSVAKIPTPTP